MHRLDSGRGLRAMSNTSDKQSTHTILVIGSTGKTGKRVTAQLEERGIDVRHEGIRSGVDDDCSLRLLRAELQRGRLARRDAHRRRGVCRSATYRNHLD